MILRLLPLARAKRVLFGAGALLCYAAAIALAPGNAHSQVAGRRAPVAVPAPPALAASPAAVAPENDAFAPRVALDDDAPPVHSSAVLPPLPHVAAAPLAPARPAPPAQVTAIATGAQPTAVITSGAGTRVVGIGDTLEGSAIERIDETGIALADGRRLSLAPATAR